MARPKVSIVVCTRNRGKPLREMMDSLVAMNVPEPLEWELVMVDNGSTDDTPEIIDSYADLLPLIHVREDQAGLSFARNRGVATASGDYIVWTDDDVRVKPDWLSAYLRAFEENPDGAYFGGRITPVFEGKTPTWLTENMERLGNAFAKRDLGESMRAFTQETGDNPFGANYAVRMEEQRRYEYPTYLGVSPKFRRVGEETAVLRAIKDEGGEGYWVPDAEVLHIIPESRQTLQYVSSYQKALGETWVLLNGRGEANFIAEQLDPKGIRVGGVHIWIWRNMIGAWAKYRLAKLTSASTHWLPEFMRYTRYRGAYDYARVAKPFD
ncbi:MAG: glycosyltransferase family 2 protein [Erythrobacter sp.]|nr:glycosyltransferase family 2 protein [Erythrobacter sp.]